MGPATEDALAAILGEGSEGTWGDPDKGGSSQVQEHLVRIQATEGAFAAIRAFSALW